ncbi:MAG: DNA-formamidopyrimidine glycosylase [Desulfuromonadaceae bacterium GWC2_58_13]|nr:MAG: DNA-formamidopyrimidine glycosylase [Desulfuromonadaceae bacterium GWC2_58_13]
MPELPEVETTRRGIAPLVEGKTIVSVVTRVVGLRWPFPPHLGAILAGRTIYTVERRAKYLLLRCDGGTLILHLGMTGHLRVVSPRVPPGCHDHVDLVFADGSCLRFNDSRRFGALLWTSDDPALHPLLAGLGPEPFDEAMSGERLYRLSRGRKNAVKPYIMDQRILVGVGNIYASEALFRAGIDPARAAGRVGLVRYRRLTAAIREVLDAAIAAGGTTIRDFSDSEGRPGYFAIQLQVYGRTGEPCLHCGEAIRQRRLGQRSTYFCRFCQH